MSAARLTWDELDVGQELDSEVGRPITVTDSVRYQGASGDMNPIHHDAAFAAKAGYPQPFTVGMLQAGVTATYATDRFGPANIRLFRVQFREQVWPGDVLTYRGKVTDKREMDGEQFIDLELVAERQTGGVHLTAWATFVVPPAT